MTAFANKTIAVLPFVNMSPHKDNEYFCDGITEEIINALAKIRQLKVTSRTSAFYYKNKNIPIKEIGKELDVSTVLEGSIRMAGDTIRITAQLIHVAEDYHFWSETWDRKLENIFEIQDEVSLLIADKLREQYGHLEIEDHLVKKQTESLEAYDYSLKARFVFNKWNVEDVRKAISMFEKALELDPNHVESLLGLADCYSFLATTGFLPFLEAWGKAKDLVEKADALDDNNAGVYYQLANMAFFVDCDYKQSFQYGAKSVRINPNFPEAQQFMSFLYIIAGEKEKSLKHLEIAISLNPLSQETLFFQGYYYYMVGDYMKAMQIFNECLEENPRNIPALTVKAYCLLKLGRYEEVIHYFDQIPEEEIVRGDQMGLNCLAHALKGEERKAVELEAILKEEASTPEGFRANSYLFLYYGATGKIQEAVTWIENAIKSKSTLLLIHYAEPLVDPIKEDPEYLKFKEVLFPQISNEISTSKKQLLDEDTKKEYTSSVLKYLEASECYLDAGLSLRSLADQVNIHPNQLSWLINESFNKNFNEFINHYRVETFKEKAKDPGNAHISLIGLAFDSGFNSKTVFNTTFKKMTGVTPREFVKQSE